MMPDPAESEVLHECPQCGEEFATIGWPGDGYTDKCKDCCAVIVHWTDYDGDTSSAGWAVAK